MSPAIKTIVLWLYALYCWADELEVELWWRSGIPMQPDEYGCREKVQRVINLLED